MDEFEAGSSKVRRGGKTNGGGVKTKNVSSSSDSEKKAPPKEVQEKAPVQSNKKVGFSERGKPATNKNKVLPSDEEEIGVDQHRPASLNHNNSRNSKNTSKLNNEIERDEVDDNRGHNNNKDIKVNQTGGSRVRPKSSENLTQNQSNKDNRNSRIDHKQTNNTNRKSQEENNNDPTQGRATIAPDLDDLESLGRMNLLAPLDPIKYTNDPSGSYEDYINIKSSNDTIRVIKGERLVLCSNYAPLPVVLSQGNGVYLKDVEGRTYIDFLSGYSAVNFGHCNSTIIQGVYQQMNNLYMTSRGFYNNKLYIASDLICKIFEYEKALFMNSGVEAGESAVKIARRWAYDVKKVPNDQAKIVFAKGNFWGRTIYACGTSDDPSRFTGFGPYETSHYLVNYNDLQDLERVLEKDPTICAVFLEPIQGEGGVNVPNPGYLRGVQELCKKYNTLFIIDEIQTGIGRTGYKLYCNSEGVKPDIVLLGKSLSGGVYPVSAMLSSSAIMNLIKPGEHGSTYGGNPLASAAVIYAMSFYLRNNLNENAMARGLEFGTLLTDLRSNRLVKEIRGRGLMFSIELHESAKYNAYDFSLWLMERGILCKPTKKNIIR